MSYLTDYILFVDGSEELEAACDDVYKLTKVNTGNNFIQFQIIGEEYKLSTGLGYFGIVTDESLKMLEQKYIIVNETDVEKRKRLCQKKSNY